MTDFCDAASDREDKFRQDAIEAQSHCPSLPEIGACYNCEDPLETGCFCNVACRDDFQTREEAKKRNGAS